MLYLEDYLEMIENLPIEMRERLTEMREVDLQVQNALDGLDERVTSFFKKCTQPNIKLDWRDEQFGKIKKDYYKSLEDADEKVQLANHIYDLVDRHLRKLDQELSKFKMELEADNAGITEILEKRSLEMDKPPALNHRVEKRKIPMSTAPVQQEKRLTTEKVLSTLANEIARDSFGPVRKTHSASSSPNISMFNSVPSSTSIPYKIGHVGASSNAAIQAAASQAIAATQQVMQCQGRRTPSMKASYVAMTKGASSSDLTREYVKQEYHPYSSQPSTPASREADSGRSQRQKKQTTKAAALLQAQQAQQQAHQQKQQAAVMSALSQQLTSGDPPPPSLPPPEPTTNELQIVDEHGETVNWQDDPNEPRYCLCNQVSYGEMVGCDNDDCTLEWFHYGCVGLTQAPKGKWYCPQCTAALKRRGRR